jgi:hypothetical protein
VARKVRSHHRELVSKERNNSRPGLRAASHAVDQEKRRSVPTLAIRHAMTVEHDLVHGVRCHRSSMTTSPGGRRPERF